MFVDRVRLLIKAGNGGNGMIAFRREKFVDKGGPSGGDGGRGASIYFIADSGLNTLLDFNNGFYTKLVEKHRIGIQGFTEKGFKIIKGIKAK